MEETGVHFSKEKRQEGDAKPRTAVQSGGSPQQREHTENAPKRGEETQSPDPSASAHRPCK